MPQAAVNGTTLHYQAVGDGPTCLVMHGWPGVDHAYLRPGLDRLAAGLRLVYYDHRGHGRSAPAGGSLTLEQLADDAAALAEHLGAHRVIVLAHAHGASVAQELALRHPERVAAMVLVAATPGELGMDESLSDAFDSAPLPPEIDVVQRVPPAIDEEVEATMLVLAPYFFRHPDGTDPVALFVEATYSAETAAGMMVTLGWWSAVDRLAGVEAPVLLLSGRHDVFAAPAQAERIARRVPAAKVVVFEESAHVPWIEEPDVFFPTVQDWLAEIRTGPVSAS